MQQLFSKKHEISLSVTFYKGGGTRIYIDGEFIEDIRKSSFYIKKSQVQNYSNLIKKVWDETKNAAADDLFLGFSEIDYYDEGDYVYETPNFSIKKGSKKTNINYSKRTTIPKGWEAFVNYYFTKNIQTTKVLQVLEQFGFNLNETQIKSLKKLHLAASKKENGSYYHFALN